ncbi:MAG: glycosyltransferase family A protein [Candidatus Omnitrophota bacterium]
MSTQPFFSVIIPTFNRKPFLEVAITSVLEQTFKDLELIVVDDGSTDGTKKLISKFKNSRIIYKHQENRGVAGARNTGLALSSGKFVAFLDSDDRWIPEKLSVTADYIQKFPDISIFHTEEIWHKNGKMLEQKSKHKKPDGHVYKNALPLCCISISTAVVDAMIFDSVGTFDEKMEACEDYDFWLRATCRHEVRLIPEYLTIKDGGRPDQLSFSVWGLDRFRIRALEKMLSSAKLEPEDYQATLDELERKCEIFATGAEKKGKFVEAEFYRDLPEKYR